MSPIPDDLLSVTLTKEDWQRVLLALRVDHRYLSSKLEENSDELSDSLYRQVLSDDIYRLDALIFDINAATNV